MKNLVRAAAAAAFLAVATVGASAQEYPSRSIRLILPFPPGGSVSIIGRMFGDAMQTAWGQPVVVDPKPGAGGVVASKELIKSDPDGHTLMMATANVAINASLYKNLGFDTEKDLVPISQIVAVPSVILARGDLPVNTLQDLVDLAKKEPGTLNYSSGGTGSAPHLAVELFKSMAGIDIEHIPYQGNAPALLALLAKDVDMMDSNIPDVLQYIKDGSIKALAVTSTERLPILPDVPTVAELGYPGYKAVGWLGFFAPRGTPDAVVQKIAARIKADLDGQQISDLLAKQGFDKLYSTPEQFATTIHEDIDSYAIAVKASGATAE